MDAAATPTLPRPAAAPAALLERVGFCTLPHPVTSLCTVPLPGGALLLAGGGPAVSVGLVSALLAPSCPAAGVEGVSVSSGVVTCVSGVPLPGASAALGVAGTSGGAVCLFLVEARGAGRGPGVCKLREVSLAEHSEGRIGAADALVDVRVALDPAGRLEFVAAASAAAVVLLDASAMGAARGRSTGAVTRADAPTHETFWTAVAEAEVARVVVPERLRAGFAVDVALLIVLDSGEVRCVERRVAGGSVQLLLQHHAQRQARRGHMGLAVLDTAKDAALDPRALSHVVYAYGLAQTRHSLSPSPAAASVVVNDATLCYDADTQSMRLVAAGVEMPSSTHPNPHTGAAEGANAWWAVTEGFVRPRGTLEAARGALGVTAFGGSKSGGLPRDRRGLAAVVEMLPDLLLFVAGNEVYRGATAEGPGGWGPLRLAHTSGAMIDAIARVEAWKDGRPAVLVASGASLTLLEV